MATRGQRILYVENATGPVLLPGMIIDPSPPGRTDQLIVAFGTQGPVTNYSDESASDVAGTWRADPAWPEATTGASLETDVAALESSQATQDTAISGKANTADVVTRATYNQHYHGVLGLIGGQPTPQE